MSATVAESLVPAQSVRRKVVLSVLLGLAGFGLNFFPIDFELPPHRVSFLIGLALPMVATLAWGWKYGLISATVGLGCQNGWILWRTTGYAAPVAVLFFTLWIVWHGWCAERRRRRGRPWWGDPYVAEIPFRLVNVILMYTVFRWVFRFNPPPWDPEATTQSISLGMVNIIVIKGVINAFIVLLIADVLLNLGPTRRLLGLPPRVNQLDTNYVVSGAILFGCLFWVVDAVFDAFLFYPGQGSFLDFLALDVPPAEVCSRTVFLIASTAGGLLVARYLRRIRQSEIALRESEENLAITLRAIGDAVIATDRDGRIVRMNLVAEKLTGWRLEEARGRELGEVFRILSDETRRPVESPVARVLREGKVVGLANHTLLVARDGIERPIADSGAPIRDDHGEVIGVVLVFRDVTEERRARQALEESEERFRSLVRTAGGMIVCLSDDRRIIEFNLQAERFFGLPREEVIGKEFGALFLSEELRERLAADVRKVLAGEVVENQERRMRGSDGREHVFLWNMTRLTDGGGAPVGVVAVGQNITGRKKAEEELREVYREREELERILAHSPAVLFLWRSDEGWPVEFVSGNVHQFGYNPSDFYRGFVRYGDLIHPDDRERVTLEMAGAAEQGLSEYVGEYRILTKDRQVRWLDGRTRIRRNADGAITHYQGIVLDVTDRKQMQERLAHVEKMEAIGQLAGGIAHDFNNQLAGIMGYADILRETLDNDKLTRYADMIVRAATRSSELTTQLLAFARKGQFRSVPVNVHVVIADVVSLLQHSIDKRIAIRQDLQAGSPMIVGDPTQLENALLNIAINARDAMPEGGELTFATRVTHLDEEYCRRQPYEVLPGRYLQITVNDTGVGMDWEVQQHVFEPFFTTKKEGEGTGMGLAAVYGTVKNHCGSIELESEPGHGTTFRVFLPLTDVPDRAEHPGAHVPAAHGTARVLIVDDEEMVREVAADMLSELGYDVAARHDGADALAYYREHWREIDLVILDMVMPEMNGLDTFVSMRGINPHIKAILSSGYGVNAQVQEALDEGALAFVQKPFRASDLAEKVAQALRRAT